MAWPTDPLDVRCVFAFGASLTAAPTSWTFKDCTSDLRIAEEVNLTVGRSDRAKQPEPNQATFSLNNLSGQYTVDNPGGANYPNVVENVPGIIAVRQNLNPTFEVDASDWAVTAGTIARSTVRAFSGSASMLITPTGGFASVVANMVAKTAVRPGGFVYTDAWVFSVAGWGSVNVAVDWFDGSGVFISTSNGPTVAVPAGAWTYLNAYIGPAPSNAASCQGKVLETGSPANTNTLWVDEARLSIPRLCGYVDGWTPAFDSTGNKATVNVSMSGIRRRLGRNQPLLQSPLTRSILGSTAAVLRQYWACEDASNSLQAASNLTGGQPLSAVGNVAFASMNYLTQTDFTVLPGTTFGTSPLPQLKQGGQLTATFTPNSASAWTFQASIFCNPISDNLTVILFQFTDSTGRVWSVASDGITADTVRLLVNGSAIATLPHIIINEDVRIDAAQSGGNINWSFKPALAYTAITGSFAGTLGGINSFLANPNATTTTGSLSVGQVRVWDGNSAADFKTSTLAVSAWNGWPGETAGDRFTRLCTETGVPFASVVNSSLSIAMGTQTVKSFLDLLLECEVADLGFLAEPFDGFGFSYVPRANLYNLPVTLTLDNAQGQLAPPFAPLHDDLLRQNDVTVTRQGGSSARFIGDTSRGVYQDGPTVNVQSDTQLFNIAAERVHLGSPRGRLRHPSLTVNFTATPTLQPVFTASQGIGIRTQVINPPSQVPQGVDVLLSGYTERLGFKQWVVSLLGSPYDVWNVGALNTNLRLEMAGQTLSANLVPGATSLSLATAAGNQLFTTTAGYPADFPLDLNVAGWQIHVTAATGAASPQTLTITAAPNTFTIPAGTPVTLWQPAALAL